MGMKFKVPLPVTVGFAGGTALLVLGAVAGDVLV